MAARWDPSSGGIRLEAGGRALSLPLSDVQRLVEDILRSVLDARASGVLVPRRLLGLASAHLGRERAREPSPRQPVIARGGLYLVPSPPDSTSG